MWDHQNFAGTRPGGGEDRAGEGRKDCAVAEGTIGLQAEERGRNRPPDTPVRDLLARPSAQRIVAGATREYVQAWVSRAAKTDDRPDPDECLGLALIE